MQYYTRRPLNSSRRLYNSKNNYRTDIKEFVTPGQCAIEIHFAVCFPVLRRLLKYFVGALSFEALLHQRQYIVLILLTFNFFQKNFYISQQ